MLEAEQVLQECRAIARKHNIVGTVATKCLGRLDTYMARLILGKKDDKFASIEEVARNFIDDLLKEGLPPISVPAPWATKVEPKPPSSSSSGSGSTSLPNLVQYDASGQVKAPEVLSWTKQKRTLARK